MVLAYRTSHIKELAEQMLTKSLPHIQTPLDLTVQPRRIDVTVDEDNPEMVKIKVFYYRRGEPVILASCRVICQQYSFCRGEINIRIVGEPTLWHFAYTNVQP